MLRLAWRRNDRQASQTIGLRRLRRRRKAQHHRLTWQRRLNEPTQVTGRLYSVGVECLDEFDHHNPFRLVAMADLTSEAGLAFIDKLRAIESLMLALSVRLCQSQIAWLALRGLR